MMSSVPVLRVSENMLLRQHTSEDARAIFALIFENQQHLNQSRVTMAEKQPSFEAVLNSIDNPWNPEELRFGIWVDELFVGGINLLPLSDADFFLSFWVGEKFLGKEYAGRASRRLIDAAFQMGRAKTIVAEASKTNQFVIDILERLEFVLVGETGYDFVYIMKRWIPFSINSNTTFHSFRSWQRAIDERRHGGKGYITSMRGKPQTSRREVKDFGHGGSYTEERTLGQWLAENKLI